MSLDATLMKILVCPKDKGVLWLAKDGSFLYNPRLRLAYDVRDGIPVMLIDEARQVGEADHAEYEREIAAGAMVSTGA